MPNKPITYMSFDLGPDAGVDDLMVGIRVIPTGRDGSTVLARTLNFGEPDTGEGIVLGPGERLLFPPGSVKVTIQDIDRENSPGSGGYAAIANTVWTWLQIGPSPDQSLFNYLFAAARRLESAHALWFSAMNEFNNLPDESFIRTRARIYRALGNIELMCIALNRVGRMIRDIPARFLVSATIPNEVGSILPALTAIRNAFEHIDERAMGNARREEQTDALSIFDQTDFVTSGVLSYANYSLDLRLQVIPALVAGRKFIFDVAIEKGGAEKVVNIPIKFGPVT